MTPQLYIGTNGMSVWRSKDLGDTIIRVPTDLGIYVGTQIWALARHDAAPEALLAGTNTGVYRMDPAAHTWSHAPSPMDDRMAITALTYAPNDPRTIYAGVQPGGVYRSDDGGETWRDLKVPISPYQAVVIRDGRIVPMTEAPKNVRNRAWTRVTQILIESDNPDRIWVGVEIDGMWFSGDGGQTWERFENGFISADIHGIAVTRNGSATVLAATNEGLHVSHDRGMTWSFQKLTSPWQYTRALASRADDSGVMFLTNGDGPPGTIGRLLRSRDHGSSWEDAGLPGEVQSTVYTIATHPADPKLIFAATNLGQIYRSTDGGETWVPLKRRLGEIRALTWIPG